MADQPEAPAPEVEDDQPDTPAVEAEPVEQEAPDGQADQSSATSPIAQAEYTRATQLAAGIRRELGLPKGATQAEVIEAIRAARDVAVDDGDDEDYEEDPALIAEREKRFASELRVTSVMYGEKFTQDGLELLNAIRTNDDLEELFGMLAAFRDSHATAAAPPAPAPDPAAENGNAESAGAEPAIGLSEGDTPPAQRQSTPAGRRESGTATAIRDIFAGLGIASRPESPAKK